MTTSENHSGESSTCWCLNHKMLRHASLLTSYGSERDDGVWDSLLILAGLSAKLRAEADLAICNKSCDWLMSDGWWLIRVHFFIHIFELRCNYADCLMKTLFSNWSALRTKRFAFSNIFQHRVDAVSWNCSSRETRILPHREQGPINPTYGSQYHGCWWPGDGRSQTISSHGIDLVLEYSGISTWRPPQYKEVVLPV